MERKPYVHTGRRAQAPRIVDQPEPGHFLFKLVRGGPWVAAEIVQKDGKWQAFIDGVEQGEPHEDPAKAPKVLSIWLYGDRATETETTYRKKVSEFAREHSPDHPAANPNKPIDLSKMKPLF